MRIPLAVFGPAALLASLLLAGCGEESQGPCGACAHPLDPPEIAAAAVVPGPHNVLSAVVTARLQYADSAAVRFGPPGGPLDRLTPAFSTAGDSTEVPVLGLGAETSYELRVLAYGAADTVLGPPLLLTTGSLPPDLPTFSAGGTDPSPGLVVFALGTYGIVIDNNGTVVWYRHLDGGSTLNFEAQPTGTYATSPTSSPSSDPTPWVEFDVLGNEVRRMGCARGLVSRFHEFITRPDGSYWLMCDETRTINLAAIGGAPSAAVTGTVVQHIGANGGLLFEWSVWDHFSITDLDSASRSGPVVNWTHGNAMDFDADSNLVISFRSLNELTKIDVHTGAVLWRMGGLANQFTFAGSGLPFLHQHGLRLTAPGHFQVLDNLGEPGGSRAEQYQFDPVAHTASLTAAYEGAPAVIAQLGGATQVLPGGHLMVAYGNGYRVQEYDASGAVAWEIHGNAGYIFRAQRIESLYRPGVGTPR